MRQLPTPSLLLCLMMSTAHVPAVLGVDAWMETRLFHVPGQGPQVEIHLAISGQSLAVASNAHGFNQSKVEALFIVEQDDAIVTFSKAEVLGPERMDSLKLDFVYRERMNLAPGSYDLLVELRDLLGDTAVSRYRSPLVIPAPGEGVFFSDVMFTERMDPAPDDPQARSGYHLVPFIGEYYPRTIGSLGFYAEVYNTDAVVGEDEPYLLVYQIEVYESRKVQGAFKRPARAKAKPTDAVVARFDISGLPSGNYLLAIEARDRDDRLLARTERFFQRNNPISYDPVALSDISMGSTFADGINNPDTLAEFITSLRPIADPLERKIIDDRWKDRDLDLMQRFFYSFWANRNSYDPESAWNEYHAQVIKVNKLFGCRVLKGYETDRGQIYLKYGAPNTMMDRFNEMDSYPYSIWHYYRAGRFTNRRFVFYQRELVGGCMELLHAEVPGEIQNPRWNQILHSRNVPMQNVDPASVTNPSGSRADEFFELPR